MCTLQKLYTKNIEHYKIKTKKKYIKIFGCNTHKEEILTFIIMCVCVFPFIYIYYIFFLFVYFIYSIKYCIVFTM